MSITTTTVNAPPTGTNALLMANGVTLSGSTGEVQFVSLIDPDSTSLRPMQITVNGLKVDGSAATQPVSGTVATSTGPGVNQTGTGQWIPIADASAVLNLTTNATTELIPAVAGKRIVVMGYEWLGNSGGGTMQFVQSGTLTPITGTFPIVSNEGMSRDSYGGIWKLPTNTGFSVTIASGANVQGSISYTYV